MKILAVGDLHITLDKVEYIGGAFTAYLKELIACECPNAVVFLGDILDYDCPAPFGAGRVDVQAMDCAVRLFTEISALIETYVLVGNHDYINPHQFLGDRHWMNSLKGKTNLTIVDEPRRAQGAVFVPYVQPKRFLEALDSLPDWRAADVIFAHQGFNGAHWHGGAIKDEDDWDSEFPPIVSGHIHAPQVLASGVWYAGSIDPAKPNQLLIVEDGKIRVVKMGRLASSKWIGTVAEVQEAKLNNCEITIQDTAENICSFKMTDKFRALAANNIVRTAQSLPFLDLYRLNILDTGDVYTYCAAEKVLEGIEQDEEEHLFIRRAKSELLVIDDIPSDPALIKQFGYHGRT